MKNNVEESWKKTFNAPDNFRYVSFPLPAHRKLNLRTDGLRTRELLPGLVVIKCPTSPTRDAISVG